MKDEVKDYIAKPEHKDMSMQEVHTWWKERKKTMISNFLWRSGLPISLTSIFTTPSLR